MPFHEQLAKHFTVYLPAHPGFADSKGLEQVRDIYDYAWHYVDLIQELKLGPRADRRLLARRLDRRRAGDPPPAAREKARPGRRRRRPRARSPDGRAVHRRPGEAPAASVLRSERSEHSAGDAHFARRSAHRPVAPRPRSHRPRRLEPLPPQPPPAAAPPPRRMPHAPPLGPPRQAPPARHRRVLRPAHPRRPPRNPRQLRPHAAVREAAAIRRQNGRVSSRLTATSAPQATSLAAGCHQRCGDSGSD